MPDHVDRSAPAHRLHEPTTLLDPTGGTTVDDIADRQTVALFVARRVFDVPAGIGLKEDFDDAFARIETTPKRKDFAAVRNLDRKTRKRTRIFFDEEVARFVRRRRWHPSQRIRNVEGRVIFAMDAAASVEMINSRGLRSGRARATRARVSAS